MGYVTLEAALRDTSGTKLLSALIKEELDQEALKNVIMRESIVRIFGDTGGNLPEYSDWLVTNRLDKWERQVSATARMRNALAHGDKELLSEATRDEAGSRPRFIGEMTSRVCGGDFLKLKAAPGAE